MHYTRELEHNGRDIKDERREFITGRSQVPYGSLRPEVIASRSFVHPLPDGRAIDRTDTAVLEAGTGTVTGTLVDSAGLAGGLWRFTMSHPSLDTLGLRPPLVEVVASPDEIVGFRYQLPSASQLLVDACGGPPRPPNTAILLGRVRTHDGESGGRTHLRVSGNTPLFSENGTAAPPGEMLASLHPCGSAMRTGSKRRPTPAASF